MKIDVTKLIADPRWNMIPADAFRPAFEYANKLYAETRDYACCLGEEPEGVPNQFFWWAVGMPNLEMALEDAKKGNREYVERACRALKGGDA